MLVADAPYGDAVEPAVIVDAARPTPKLHGVDAAGWETVLARALALRTADRFADARSLYHALEAALPTAELDATISSPYAAFEKRLALTTDAKPTTPGMKTELETIQAVSGEPTGKQPKPATRTGLYAAIAAALVALGVALSWGTTTRPPAPVASVAVSALQTLESAATLSPSASLTQSASVVPSPVEASAVVSASAAKTAVSSAKIASPASTQSLALPSAKPTGVASASPLSTKPTLR
jgi:hypothetical protein